MNKARHLVSKKKKRWIEDGYDLDLSYVLPNVIAMGYPSTGVEGLYRNKRAHVVAFLQLRHGEHFRVYNLCSERHYALDVFGPGKVAEYPFDDHNPSPLWLMIEFVADALTFLEAAPENVVAIHCKAGKGRTGLFICALLLALGKEETAAAALEFYAGERTKDGKGVTIPSQQRYVGYYGTVLAEGGLREPVSVHLTAVRLWGPMPRLGGGGIVASVKVFMARQCVGGGSVATRASGTVLADAPLELALSAPDGLPLMVTGDVLVVVYHKRKVRGTTKAFQFWFHASYLPRAGELVLPRAALDKANKSSKYADTFRASLVYGGEPIKAATRPRSPVRAPLQPSPLAPVVVDARADESHYTYEYEYAAFDDEDETDGSMSSSW